MTELEKIKKRVEGCFDCPLGYFRIKTVFGEGPENAKVMFVGEGPGAEENKTGKPFVGKSGEFLDDIFSEIKINRKKIYITNIVKCRSFNEYFKDCAPKEWAVSPCKKYLKEQIILIRPKVIITMGNPAKSVFFPKLSGITTSHGTIVRKGFLGCPTFHPSFILRTGGHASPNKKLFMADIRKAIKEGLK